MASKSSALRDLRMSTAMSSMTLNRTRSILAPSTSTSRKRVQKDSKLQEELDKKENSKSFTAAPQRTLNLVTPNTKRDWLQKADEIIKSKPKETKKVRKKRLWLQRKNQQKSGLKDKTEQKQRYIGDWAFLPDIALELIFQYLPFEQKTKMGAVCQNWARNMAFCSVRSFFQFLILYKNLLFLRSGQIWLFMIHSVQEADTIMPANFTRLCSFSRFFQVFFSNIIFL